jgi:C-22 sterol desaturase
VDLAFPLSFVAHTSNMGLDAHADVLYNASSSYAPSFAQGTTLSWFYTTVGIIGGLLALEQAVYRYKKRHLPGDNWTIPVIGRFADSMSPSIEGYQKQWDSGPLSVVSVFNM